MSDSISNASVFSDEFRIVLSRVVQRLNVLTGDYVPPPDPIDPTDPVDPPPDPTPDYGLTWDPYDEIDATSGNRDAGFYAIPVFGNTKRIYCAKLPYTVEGVTVTPSDSNNGLSILAPKLSEAEAFKLMELGRSCHVYFRADTAHNDVVYSADDSGTGSSTIRNAFVGGESFAKPSVVTWFGTPEGNRPKMRPPIALGVDSRHSYTWWDGIHLYYPESDPNSPLFTGAESKSLQYLNKGIRGILIQDCEFSGVEIKCQNQDNSGMNQFIVHRCLGHYTYYPESSINNHKRPSWAYISKTSGVVFTENVSKWAGWHPEVEGAGPNMYNHWLYFGETDSSTIVDDCLVQHNLIFEPSAHAWQLRGGGTAIENICIGHAVGPSYGYIKRTDFNAGYVADGTIHVGRRNLILKTKSMRRVEDGCQNGVCTTARWGMTITINNTNVSYDFEGDVIAHTEDTPYDTSTNTNSVIYGITDTSIGQTQSGMETNYPQYLSIVSITDLTLYHFDSATQGDELNLVDPTRDVGGYFSLLSGNTLTDEQGVDFCLTRPKSTWDPQYANSTIHAWIYAGYRPAA